MLRLQKITAKLTSQLFSHSAHIYFRILIGKINKTTAKSARIDNQYTICWAESMTMSMVDSQEFEYQFEIFGRERDEGVADQDTVKMVKSKNILRGKIGFSLEKGHVGSWDILFGYGRKVGTLTAQIVSTTESIKRSLLKSQQNLTIQYETPVRNVPRVLRILSIVARLPNIYLNKGYFCIEVGEQVLKTPQLKSRSGELVFTEPRQIQLPAEVKEAEIKIYPIKGDKQQPIAEAFLDLSTRSPVRRLTLMKDSFEAGQLYIQMRLINKNQTPTTNYVQNLNKSKTIAVDQLEDPLLRNKKAKSFNPYHSLDTSNLNLDSHIQTHRTHKQKLDTSMVSTVSKKRNSVVHQNASIMFPREKRFMQYQDQQNEQISYLGFGERSFQFQSLMSGRYKGASFGYGDKTDFADKNRVPGVGYYKLPSIWDRY